MTQLRTERLLLRRWREEDLEPYVAMNSDPRVMEFFPSIPTREESLTSAARIDAHFDEHGFGLFAVERPDVAPFIGFIGLGIPRFEAHFMPCVEIGWRLAAEHWNHGFATEGAKVCLEWAFDELGFDEIVSFTAVVNRPSRRVMEKLGMERDPSEDFDHPSVDEGSPIVLDRAKAARA